MNLADRDLFEMYRLILANVCAVYALVVTGRSLHGWLLYFSGRDRTTNLIRRYAVVQLLRLRLGSFGGEMTRIALWLLLLVVLLAVQIA